MLTELKVVPHYGNFDSVITWKQAPALTNLLKYVERSHDGVANWKVIGETTDCMFHDKDVVPLDRRDGFFYRVKWQTSPGCAFTYSGSCSTFGVLSRKEFGAARKIMLLELRQCRIFHSVKIFLVNRHGVPCEYCTDPTSGQQIGKSACSHCYGTGMKGGYLAPLQNYMRNRAVSPRQQPAREAGTGTDDPTLGQFCMVPFPMLQKGDLIVEPATDNRWLVDTNTISYFAGKAPVLQQPAMQLIERTNIKYRVPV